MKDFLSLLKDAFLIGIIIVFFGFIVTVFYFNTLSTKESDKVTYVYKDTTILINLLDSTFNQPFNKDSLKYYLIKFNVRFPDIVYAQAVLESGFNSYLFRNNNNLFGMTYTKNRLTTALGSKNGYAYYSSWKESLYDYMFFQAIVMRDCRTREQYFNKLNKIYAVDSSYSEHLKPIIQKLDLNLKK